MSEIHIFKFLVADLGTIKVGELQTILFPFSEGTKITKLEVSCDCTSPVINNNKKYIKADYTPQPIPPHLTQQGYYEPTKMMKVWWQHPSLIEGQYTEITFKAKVIP